MKIITLLMICCLGVALTACEQEEINQDSQVRAIPVDALLEKGEFSPKPALNMRSSQPCDRFKRARDSNAVKFRSEGCSETNPTQRCRNYQLNWHTWHNRYISCINS